MIEVEVSNKRNKRRNN